MPLHTRVHRSILVVYIIAVLFSGLACSSEKNVTAPAPPAPPPAGSGPPIEIRQDAFAYGFLAPVTIRSARMDGRTLRLEVSYTGGCSTHTFAAIAGTGYLSSYPAQLVTFLRHDDAGDQCDSTIVDDLSFDVTPVAEQFRTCFGTDGPFYLRIVTPPDRTANTLVLYGTNPLGAPGTK